MAPLLPAAAATVEAAAVGLAATLRAYPQLSRLNDMTTTSSNATFTVAANVLNLTTDGWPVAGAAEGAVRRGIHGAHPESRAAVVPR